MNKSIRVIKCEEGQSPIELWTGFASSFPGIAYLGNSLSGGKLWNLYMNRVYTSTTTTAELAFSFNRTSGCCYIYNYLAFQWDVTEWDAIWTTYVATTFYSVAQATTRYVGINYTLAESITATTAAFAYGEINPDRTALNATTTNYNLPLYFLVWRR